MCVCVFLCEHVCAYARVPMLAHTDWLHDRTTKCSAKAYGVECMASTPSRAGLKLCHNVVQKREHVTFMQLCGMSSCFCLVEHLVESPGPLTSQDASPVPLIGLRSRAQL